MIFMVPATPGTHTLDFTVGTQAYSGPITVTAAQAVANPATFLDAIGDVADARLVAMSSVVDAHALTGDSLVAADMLDEARDSLASFRTTFAQMTPAQKQQVADILNANLSAEHRALVLGAQAGSLSAAAYQIPAACAAKATALEQYQCTWGSFFTSLKDVAKYLGGAALAAETSAVTGLVGIGVSAVFSTFALVEGVNTFWLGIELLRIHGMLVWEIGAAVVDATKNFFRADVVAADPGMTGTPAGAAAGPVAAVTSTAPFASAFAAAATPASSMTRVTHDRPLTFRFSPKLRPVQMSDRSLPLSWVSGALRLVAEYNRLVARYDAKYQLKFATPAASFPSSVPHAQIDVEVVTNSKVKVKSVTGSGDLTQVVFTTTAAGVQPFTYDVIYTSGVYPEVRVRYAAELHPPTFMLTDLDGRELPDTMRLMGRWQYNYLLLENDGSRIDPNLSVQLHTQGTYQGGANVTMTYTYNSNFYLNTNVEPNRTRMVDTIPVTVVKDGAPLRDMTFIVTDSLGMYNRMVPGVWIHTYVDVLAAARYRDRIVFNANGTGTITSRVNTGTGETVTNYDPAITWRLWQENEGGRPVFELDWGWPGFGYSMNLRYGSTSHQSPQGNTLVRE
jgi:hypothetical protein